jgi:putative ABC transport system substrate-binding protein
MACAWLAFWLQSLKTGNLTGLTFFGGGKLGAKRLELLHELVPKATVIGLLMDPNWPGAVAELPELEAAGPAIGAQVVVARASNEGEFESAFATIVRSAAGALIVAGSPFFTSQRRTLVALAARHAPFQRFTMSAKTSKPAA